MPKAINKDYIDENGITFKWCNYGQHHLPATQDNFYRNKRYADGMFPYCIHCTAKVTARNKRIRKNNPKHKMRVIAQDCATRANMRAKQLGIEGRIKGADIETIYNLQEGRCKWCEESLSDTFGIDHIVPMSKGGENTADNICVSCAPCNFLKESTMPAQFLERYPHGSLSKNLDILLNDESEIPLKRCVTGGHYLPATTEYFSLSGCVSNALVSTCKECKRKSAKLKRQQLKSANKEG